MKWEYYVTSERGGEFYRDQTLSALGQQGWEHVSTTFNPATGWTRFYLKRPVRESYVSAGSTKESVRCSYQKRAQELRQELEDIETLLALDAE